VCQQADGPLVLWLDGGKELKDGAHNTLNKARKEAVGGSFEINWHSEDSLTAYSRLGKPIVNLVES